MVDAITGYIINKISDYLVQEASLLLGVKDEVEGLKEELLCIQGFLKDTKQVEYDMSHAFREWTNQVRDIAYEAEDTLDNYLLKVEEERSKRGFLHLIKRGFCIICEKADTYNIAQDIKSLKKRINDLSRKFEMYCKDINVKAQKATSSKQRRLKEIRRAPSVIEEEHVIGVKDDADGLLAKLIDGDSKTYMISIYGIGGLGKTALARKLYNSAEVKERFDDRGWTCVSQEYETSDLLRSIIKSFQRVSESELERINTMTKDDLERYLRDFLKGKRYLAVVDDVWEKEAWESLKRSFPRNVDGSKVIMTTRIKDVAEGVDERVYAHNLRFLKPNESWELFRKKAFRDQERVNIDLETLCKEMVDKCRGLPLAIIVLAGILRKKEHSEWQAVHDYLWRSLRDDSIHISALLDLSFNGLDYELKLCFLYLGIFPEDFEIDVETLIHLLVAEGFIQEDEDGMILEDVAWQYVHELMDKSLVLVGKRLRGRIRTCRVHDLLRDLAIRKAKELNFIDVNGGRTPRPSTCRREVVHYVPGKGFPTSSLHRKVRSLFLNGGKDSVGLRKHDQCGNFKLLRVLDFGTIFRTILLSPMNSAKPIGKLIHLRYLGMFYHGINNMPSSFSNLRYLQTLDASNCSFEETVDLRKLTSLKHVYGRFLGDLLIGDTIKLETLEHVTTRCWNKISEKKLINLRKLVIYDPDSERNAIDVYLGMGSFSNAKNLRTLEVETRNFNFSPPAEYPPNLESLTIWIEKLEGEDPMPMLEKLPRLQDLYLRVLYSSTKELICSAKGFPRLKALALEIYQGLEDVNIAKDAMTELVEWKQFPFDDGVNLMIPERLKVIIEPIQL